MTDTKPDDTLDRIADWMARAAYDADWNDEDGRSAILAISAAALKEKLRGMVEKGQTMADNFNDLCDDDVIAWRQALADAAGEGTT